MPLPTKPIVGITDADRARFMRYVNKQPDGCWLWKGHRQSGGYGHFSMGDRNKLMAYRFAYTAFVAPIPHGLTIDHLCRVPACVNPGHLEAVTTGENTLRSPNTLQAQAAAKTQCKRGHPLDGVQRSRRGVSRYCKTCRRTKWGGPPRKRKESAA